MRGHLQKEFGQKYAAGKSNQLVPSESRLRNRMRPAWQLQVEEANKHRRLLVLEAAMCLGRKLQLNVDRDIFV